MTLKWNLFIWPQERYLYYIHATSRLGRFWVAYRIFPNIFGCYKLSHKWDWLFGRGWGKFKLLDLLITGNFPHTNELLYRPTNQTFWTADLPTTPFLTTALQAVACSSHSYWLILLKRDFFPWRKDPPSLQIISLSNATLDEEVFFRCDTTLKTRVWRSRDWQQLLLTLPLLVNCNNQECVSVHVYKLLQYT